MTLHGAAVAIASAWPLEVDSGAALAAGSLGLGLIAIAVLASLVFGGANKSPTAQPGPVGFSGAADIDDDPFADAIDAGAGGLRSHHRRQSWEIAKEEAVSFILMSPSGAKRAQPEPSASPSVVVRVTSIAWSAVHLTFCACRSRVARASPIDNRMSTPLPSSSCQIEPFTGTRAQATARKRPAEADAGETSSAFEAAESIVSPSSKRVARGVLFPDDAPLSPRGAVSRGKPRAAGPPSGAELKPFSPGLRDVTNTTPERKGQQAGAAAASGLRGKSSKRHSAAAAAAAENSPQESASVGGGVMRSRRGARSSMPARGVMTGF